MSDTRIIPDNWLPAAEQSLLNMAIRGYHVINPDGVDLTDSLVAQGHRISSDFDRALSKSRSTQSISDPATRRHQAKSAPTLGKPGYKNTL